MEDALSFGKLVEPPKGFKGEKTAENMTLISIPISLTVNTEGRVKGYKPYYYKLYDGNGHAYAPAIYKVTKSKNWIRTGTMIQGPGIASIILSHEVPADSKHLHLLVNGFDLLPGDIVVNVK